MLRTIDRMPLLLALLAAGAAPALAQTALEVGESETATIAAGETQTYTLEVETDTFVFGAADQLTVDLVVTVFDGGGKQIGRFDGPARGPEQFSFTAGAAGEYRVEVTPFEGQSGEYEIAIRLAEPVATDPARRVDQLMIAYDDPRTPGGVVGVMQGGELVFAKAYGSADLTHGIPFGVDTPTNIGSTSKQFMAYGILLLTKAGKLDIDDDVREYIPELPDFGPTVRLRHLLTHTSGYREFINTIILTGRQIDKGDHVDRSEIIPLVQRQPELQNEPGAEWNYNNTAFALLAMVIERVGGEPFPEWMKHNVFEPLGMEHTVVRGDGSIIVEHRAQGYNRDSDGEWQNATDIGGSPGAGGIYTTLPDLAKWVKNYHTGELGGHEIFEQMTTPFVLNDGKATKYGFGLFIDEFRGTRRIQHGGADIAHRSQVMYLPELDAAVITQSNNASFDGSITNAVAEAFFGDSLEPAGESAVTPDDPDAGEPDADAAFDPAEFEPERFDAYAGRYELEEVPGFILEFTREGGKYYTQATGQPRAEIVPTGPEDFKLLVVEASVTFHREADGTVKRITLHQNGEHPANRLAEEADAVDLSIYAGRYFSEELETFYTISVEDGKLRLDQRRFPEPVTLTHTKGHTFAGSMPIANARFEVGEDGRVTALLVGNGRTRGVRFVPVE